MEAPNWGGRTGERGAIEAPNSPAKLASYHKIQLEKVVYWRYMWQGEHGKVGGR